MFYKTFTIIAVAVIALVVSAAQATTNEAIQTDWSGGPGKPGPVTDWGDTFDSEDYVSWSSWPGDGEFLPHGDNIHIRWKVNAGAIATAEWNWTVNFPGSRRLKDLWFDPFIMMEKEVTW